MSRSADSFVTLNTANLENITVLRVPRGAVIEEPIQLTYTAPSDRATHPRTVILVGANAQCTIVERYLGAGRYFTNAVTDIVAEDSAVVDHYKVQQESPEAFHVATLQARFLDDETHGAPPGTRHGFRGNGEHVFPTWFRDFDPGGAVTTGGERGAWSVERRA